MPDQIFKPSDEETQLFSKQSLEIAFNGLKILTRQMLYDILDEGYYFLSSRLKCAIWNLTKSVGTTNVESK